MEQIVCCSCGNIFERSVRHKNQCYCPKSECQKARKAAWKRYKMHSDPDYKFNQTLSNKKWAKANLGYWKAYRQRHPEKAERNRMLQSIRNRRRRSARKNRSDEELIAKVDALKVNIFDIPMR